MEHGPFIDGLPSYKMGGFSMAMLNNQMVNPNWLMVWNMKFIFPNSWDDPI